MYEVVVYAIYRETRRDLQRMAPTVVTILFLVALASAVPIFQSTPSDQTVMEGGDVTFSCDATLNGARRLLNYRIRNGAGDLLQSVQHNVTDLSTVNGVVGACVLGEFNSQLVLKGVTREANDYTVACSILNEDETLFIDQTQPPGTMSVIYPPVYSLIPNQPTAVLEKGDFTYSFGFEAKPTPTNFTWSRDGQVISSNGRIATSVSTISITSTTRSDSGVYEVVSYNEAGRGAANFTLDVQVPPLIINRASQTALVQGDDFSFDCTSEPANPAAVDYTFQKDGQTVDGSRATVQGPVLTITSVQTGDGGNYSCSANNSVGRDTVFNNLIVIVPPGDPEAVTVSDVGPFAATVSWQPPLEDGGAVGPLMYTVTLTNTLSGSEATTFNPTAALTMNLVNLSHSVTYGVQVVAGNEAGMGPAAEVMFRTNDTVPTVSGVEAIALTLDTVQVDVTVSDDGGQPVLEYTATINGTTELFDRSGGNVTGLSLMNGVTYTVSVIARNSIGDSETFTGNFSVPFPPNIAMQPVAVTPDETTTRCCAGVRVFLEDPSDPTLVFTAQVSTEGSPFSARSVTREGDVVYVQGLQAGTPYNIKLTGRNQFGSVTKEVSTTPLIGYPSNPSMPVVSVEGSSASIQLSTRYPGTNARGQFRFSLIFSAASTAKRQSLQPTEVRVDPTGLDSSVTTTHTLTDVAAGSYSVSVMAVNENGMSQDVTAALVVEGTVDTAVVIGVVVAIVIVILLIILAIFVIVLIYMKRRDTKAMCKPKNEGSGDADYKEMVDTNSTDPLAQHYEDPSTLERQAPPPVVTYKKEEEAAAVQPAPAASGVIYADLDFSRQQALGSKKPEKKKPEPIEQVVYSEVRLMTPQEKQQGQERGEGEVGGDGAEPHSPTTIM